MFNIAETFHRFCSEIHLHSNDFMVSVAEITKKLNKKYYEDDSAKEHQIVVGSIGRGTAVEGVSDVDVIFELPQDVYRRFNGYDSNGQSALLQEVKECIQERYPNTDIKGDGQVVDIFFDKYTVELVPAFRQCDNRFKYPDSHDDGSWKITDPLSEQQACKDENNLTNGNFGRVANIIRAWKNNQGFKFGGLLVDTLVYNFFNEHDELKASAFGEYYPLCQSVFEFFSKQDPEQSFWLAPGSNQQVQNCEDGVFVKRSRKAYERLSSAKEDEREDVLIDLLGRKFSSCVVHGDSKSAIQKHFGYDFYSAPNEEFIEDKFRVDITNSVKLDCRVTQDGFRPFWLSSVLSNKINQWLSKNKKLLFTVTETDVKAPYEVYWKVRNVGAEAQRRTMERGQIFRDAGRQERGEHTDFNGIHYVECFIVKNNVCVARTKITVPINVGYIDREHLLIN